MNMKMSSSAFASIPKTPERGLMTLLYEGNRNARAEAVRPYSAQDFIGCAAFSPTVYNLL
jgi:hypothetical protein